MRKYLKNNLLIADGAMGTYLYQLGTPVAVNYEELNLTNPELVFRVHRQYIDAGAGLIQTNTYMANREKLSAFGLEGKVREINRSAVRIAKKAASGEVFVAGTIGGLRGIGSNSPHLKEILKNVREQLDILLEEEVDAIIFETYFDLEELYAVLSLARELTDIPVISNLSRFEGINLTEVFTELKERGADVVGLNCRTGPHRMIEAFTRVPLMPGVYFSAYPNAGLPDYVDGRYEYESTPEYFGRSALRLKNQGVRLLGGCCGTTPAHIREMAGMLEGLSPVAEKEVAEDSRSAGITFREKETEAKTALPELLQKRHSVIVELDPPKDLDYEDFLFGCQMLKRAGADAVTIADNSLAVARMSNMALAAMVKEKIGLEPLVHITCRDRNLIAQQSHLMGLYALGINHVLVITGDPARFGNFPGSTSVYDLNSFELIRLIKQMNAGFSFLGQPLKLQTSFVVGGAFNPNVRNPEKAVQRLLKKIDLGIDYVMTQPVYSVEKVEEIYRLTKHLDVPVYIGVMPLVSSRNAEFIHNEVPGIKLSKEVRERMARVKGEQARREGIAIAREIIDAVIEKFAGVYLITPFMRYEMTAELTEYIVTKTRYNRRMDKRPT